MFGVSAWLSVLFGLVSAWFCAVNETLVECGVASVVAVAWSFCQPFFPPLSCSSKPGPLIQTIGWWFGWFRFRCQPLLIEGCKTHPQPLSL